jgi:hypothetical protein
MCVCAVAESREAQERPPKWSKELLDWRRRQHLLARQHNYAEAQKVKKVREELQLQIHSQV